MSPPPRTTVHDLLDTARARLVRVEPEDALEAQARGAAIVDIRTAEQRDRDGLMPGALFHPRNVLEWRLDPASGASDPAFGADLDRPVIVCCDAGYASSLAAATLQDLGFVNAADLVGGFQAWREAGLPVER